MITLDLSNLQLKLQQQDGRTKVFDPIRKKWLVLTPEEHVRQYILQHLVEKMQYPTLLLSVEKMIQVGNVNKRFDIVVYDRDHKPWMLVECKEPGVPITERTLHQLLSYQSVIQCPYWLLTNGHETFCADASDIRQIKWLDSLPMFGTAVKTGQN